MLGNLVISPTGAVRLRHARAWLRDRRTDEPVWVVGESQQRAADLVTEVAGERGALFGWRRISWRQLVTELADSALIAEGRVPVGRMGLEAICARVIAAANAEDRLQRLADVTEGPGLATAVANTIAELREHRVDQVSLGEPLATLLAGYERALDELGLADRASTLQAACDIAPEAAAGCSILLLDVPLSTPLDAALAEALLTACNDCLATVPTGDETSASALEALLERKNPGPQAAVPAIARLHRGLFAEVEQAPPADAVRIFSAPGEARECAEIARRIHGLAHEGLPFDRVAVLLRTPSKYSAHLAEAFRRADIPAHFSRGIRRPHLAGRAFLSLLQCAHDCLSVRHFAEYLSLGQVPITGHDEAPCPNPEFWVPCEDDPSLYSGDHEAEPLTEQQSASAVAIRRWERLLVDSAVIGGHQRWHLRLDRLEAELREQLAAIDGDAPFAAQIARDLSDLDALRRTCIPIIDRLHRLPRTARWQQWLEHLRDLSEAGLRHPEHVLAILSELWPMGEVGPVDLSEVIAVLRRRLTQVTDREPARRFGCVWVAPIDDARGASFDAVFIPGLAEKLFPHKVVEDPLLSDAERERMTHTLPTSSDRILGERFLLRLACGAAEKQVFFSYPRIDVEQARPRVPSFYALEVMRAAEGVLPDFETLGRRAEVEADTHLGWPAPRSAISAIDTAEHDLALLRPNLRRADKEARGVANYLVSANAHLGRALRFRARRYKRTWTSADGLYRPKGLAAEALRSHQLDARAYSPTALQNFAICPYRFFLQAVMRLRPRDEPVALEAISPMERGSLIHEVQYRLLTLLRQRGALPLRPEGLEQAGIELDSIFAEAAAQTRDALAPTIERIWHDSIAEMRSDLRRWLEMSTVSTDNGDYMPAHFELAFGLGDRSMQDPQSVANPVTLDCGIRLRGSIDLVERHQINGVLRATDYKTGKATSARNPVIFGGEVLQPILYALTLEKIFPDAPVGSGHLFFCTQRGGFESVEIDLDERARAGAETVARAIGAALEEGHLIASPKPRMCEWCDYQPVCGREEEQRTQRKPPYPALMALREQR